MSKYDPLTDYLRGRPEGEWTHTLSLDEMERVLGTSLPRTAWIDRPWWANTQRSNHARKWLQAGWKVGQVDLTGKRVTFMRVDGEAALLRQTPGGYEKLKRFLATLPLQQEQLALTFDDLGKIMGQKLPKTASHDRPWWANTTVSPQGAAWLAAGWRLENVYLGAQVTVFRRKGKSPLRSIPKYVKAILNGTAHPGRPDSHTLSDWMRVCRKVGWYFEGTVLFERGGLSMDALNESERVEVEEDYAVCRRELRRYKNL